MVGLSQGVAGLFGLGAMTFLLGSLTVSGDMEPAYGIPKAFLGIEPGWASILKLFPTMLLILGGAMVIFTALIWRRRYFNLGGRLHYSFITVAALTMLWVFSVWNVI